jgi:plastocyanin
MTIRLKSNFFSTLIAALVLVASLGGPLKGENKMTGVVLASSPIVHIDNFAFTPAEMTVAPGTTVT